MKTTKPKRIRWRQGSQSETLAYIHLVDESERSFCHFPDGHLKAVRVQMNRDTNELLLNDKGQAMLVCPWLLADIFSV